MTDGDTNDSWLVEVGDLIVEKKSQVGIEGLSAIERLVYCLWVADYGMRNAGSLKTAQDVYREFKQEGEQLATELKLPLIRNAFSLPMDQLQNQYFEQFDGICEEIRRHYN